MARHLALFILLAGSLLIAAAPRPAATTAPTLSAPAPTFSPLFGESEPTVIVYPFEAPSDLDPRYGTAIANIYAQVLSQSGGVNVLAVPSGIKRVDYATYAHVQHADYYIGGYIQPIGSSAAIVSQVVDVSTGIAVVSSTTTITDVQDVASQALSARSVILEAAGIASMNVDEAPQSTPAPSATANGASVAITNVLSDLFKGKSRSKGSGPEPTATPEKPARGVIVAHLVGSAPHPVLGSGGVALLGALNAHYDTTTTNIAWTDLTKSANSICGVNRDNTIVSGKLDVQHVGGFRAHDSYTFTLNVYACYGAVLYTNTQTDDNYAKAIRDAVEEYYADHPENNG